MILCTDICKSYSRIFYSDYLFHIYAAHYCKLSEHFCPYLYICSCIYKHERTSRSRHYRCKSRSFDSLDTLDKHCRSQCNCSAVSCADKGISLTLCSKPESDCHRAVLFFLENCSRVILHTQLICRIIKCKAGNVKSVFLCTFFNLFYITDKGDIYSGILLL